MLGECGLWEVGLGSLGFGAALGFGFGTHGEGHEPQLVVAKIGSGGMVLRAFALWVWAFGYVGVYRPFGQIATAFLGLGFRVRRGHLVVSLVAKRMGRVSGVKRVARFRSSLSRARAASDVVILA